jgi:hypothetical protein
VTRMSLSIEIVYVNAGSRYFSKPYNSVCILRPTLPSTKVGGNHRTKNRVQKKLQSYPEEI